MIMTREHTMNEGEDVAKKPKKIRKGGGVVFYAQPNIAS
jgi:hypothetical protein